MIDLALVPVAGWGTRMLPATKSQPKEMLPVGRKPVVQYVIEELVNSGIRQVLFITGQGKTSIENHFDIDAPLITYLRETGREEQLQELQFERHVAVRQVRRTDEFVPAPPAQARCDQQNDGGKDGRNARSRRRRCSGGLGAGLRHAGRRRRLSDDSELDEQPHTGDETDQAADGADVEERAHGGAAFAIGARQCNHQQGKPDPSGEQTENAGQETDDEAHRARTRKELRRHDISNFRR